MPRDYKHIADKFVAGRSLFHGGSFGLGLGIGLVMTVLVYLAEDLPSLSRFIVEKFQTSEPPPEKFPVAGEEAPLEPTFDFYKILPNMEVNVSEYETGDETLMLAKAPDDPSSTYVLQVGSFKRFEAADRVKAKLALLGVSADIQRVVINGQDVYHRVRVGPHKDPVKLEEAQQQLLSNNLHFELLKLTVENL